MDAQGRGRADGIDPADQWVFDPKTGSYELRLDPSDTSGPSSDHVSPADARSNLVGGNPSGGAPGPQKKPVPGARSGGRPLPEQRGGRRGGKAPAGKGDKNAAAANAATGRRKPKPKKSTKKKVLLWTGGTLAFLLVGGSLGAYLLYQHLNGNIEKVDVGVDNEAVPDGPVNILVIGTDKRSGKGNTGYGDDGSVGHADTTLLFHVAEDRSNATVVSIPRDMITDIPECPTKKDGTTRNIPGSKKVRFNESLGQEDRDPGCTWRTVEKITGLKVSHFMMADFNAVKSLSSAVGGVEVCVAKDVNDPKSHLKLSRGKHEIEGEQALAFVRTRHSFGFESDLDRIKLQQQFLSSMIRKIKSNDTLTDPKKLYDLSNAATKSLTVDTGIGSITKLTSLAKELSKVSLKNITFTTLPVMDNPADGKIRKTVIMDEAKAEPLLAMVREDVSLTEVKRKEKAAKDKADAAEKEKDAKQAALLKGPKAEPAKVRVKVLNGSGKVGAAQETVTWMQNTKAMPHAGNGGNAGSGGQKVSKTTLEFAPNQADQARALAEAMGLPADALHQTDKDAAPLAEMTLTLGADFKGAGVPVTPPKAPKQAPKDIQRVEADNQICAK
ncbi:LCP family protein [Streptomyces sp. NPDC021100]|uniref:LCP family protein n=1 Tax=Streptomyces sp. NPDC021100 TaxID=3365114 RepID=UPI0037B01A29